MVHIVKSKLFVPAHSLFIWTTELESHVSKAISCIIPVRMSSTATAVSKKSAVKVICLLKERCFSWVFINLPGTTNVSYHFTTVDSTCPVLPLVVWQFVVVPWIEDLTPRQHIAVGKSFVCDPRTNPDLEDSVVSVDSKEVVHSSLRVRVLLVVFTYLCVVHHIQRL